LPEWQFQVDCVFSPYDLPYGLFSLTDFAPHFVVRSNKASPQFPEGSVAFQLRADHGVLRRGYLVDHKTWYAYTDITDNAPSRPSIYYNPHHPLDWVVGPIVPPWMILAFALGIAALLSFFGYQFR
jgi:hypothetical protein